MKLTDLIKALTGYGTTLVLTYAATVNLDFAASLNRSRTLALTGDVTFTTSNRVAGRQIYVRVVADGSLRNFTFPGTWRFIGVAAPASIAASKIGMLRLRCYGTTDADVVAEWVVEI